MPNPDLGQSATWPKGVPAPESQDIVQVLMPAWMVPVLLPGVRLAGPVLFSEDDVPTYIIETEPTSRGRTDLGVHRPKRGGQRVRSLSRPHIAPGAKRVTSPGVVALVEALKCFKREYACDSVSATYRLPDGRQLTVQMAGELLTIEREDGHLVVAPAELQP